MNIALEYLLTGSETSLQNAMLARLADAKNRRKEIIELLDKWVEKEAEAMLLQWFLEHGEALAGSLVRPELMREDFRESLKSLLKSA